MTSPKHFAKSEVIQMAQIQLQGQPFPYILLASEGFEGEDGIIIFADVEMRDGEQAAAFVHALRMYSDKLEEKYFDD
jgi:hypothetical protein